MKPSLLQKYFIKEFIPSFFSAIFVLAFITSLSSLLSYQNQAPGVFGLWNSLKVCFFIMVEHSHIIIPMSLLYSLLMVLSSLTSHNEIIALQSCGFSKFIFFKPILFISLFFFFLSLIVSGFAGPLCYKNLKKTLVGIIQEKSVTLLKEGVFNEGFFHYVIYVEKINNKEKSLKNIILFKTGGGDDVLSTEGVIFAKTGYLLQQEYPFSMLLQLQEGTYNTPMEGFQKIEFQRAHLKLVAESDVESGRAENKQMLHILFKNRKQSHKMQYLFHSKVNLSLATFIFGFFVLSLFSSHYKPQKGIAFVLTLLGIFMYFGYYSYLERTIGRFDIESIPYFVALPNLLLLLLSCFILYRAYDR